MSDALLVLAGMAAGILSFHAYRAVRRWRTRRRLLRLIKDWRTR